MCLILKTRTVYIVSSALTPKVYIGSTSQKLAYRLSKHKSRPSCKAREIIQLGEYKITPLCIVENCTRKEIELKEQDFIFCFKDICVNLKGTKDSKSKDYVKPYILDGRNKEHQNTKNECCVCDGKYTNHNKARHFKSKKHLSKI
jgi:hypothetical protein